MKGPIAPVVCDQTPGDPPELSKIRQGFFFDRDPTRRHPGNPSPDPPENAQRLSATGLPQPIQHVTAERSPLVVGHTESQPRRRGIGKGAGERGRNTRWIMTCAFQVASGQNKAVTNSGEFGAGSVRF